MLPESKRASLYTMIQDSLQGIGLADRGRMMAGPDEVKKATENMSEMLKICFFVVEDKVLVDKFRSYLE